MNGYKFHTHAWSEVKRIINSRVHVKDLIERDEDDLYGLVQRMYEVEYNSSTLDQNFVSFYYNWFDPSTRGTRVDSKYGIMDIQMDKIYVPLDLFILAHNV